MLMIARLIAAALGAFMLYFVLGGLLVYPEFTIPDLTLGTLLIVSALLPGRWRAPALMTASAFALGVYCVAVTNQIDLGKPINPPLIVVIAMAMLVYALTATSTVRSSSQHLR